MKDRKSNKFLIWWYYAAYWQVIVNIIYRYTQEINSVDMKPTNEQLVVYRLCYRFTNVIYLHFAKASNLI